jgi:hypothetical protein
MDYHHLDLMSMAYIKYKNKLNSISLNSVSDLIGIPKEPMPHTALNGAMQAYYLFKHLVDPKENLSQKFLPYTKDPVFLEVLDLVKQNSKGKIWVIGGYVYKNIINSINNIDKIYNYDIDFIVEERNNDLKEVSGWRIETNNYGSQNYVRDGNKMSFTDIHKAVRVSGLKKLTIDQFIEETPLNIQSIAYDLQENKLIGEKGIDALISKSLKVNNPEQAKFYAERKDKKVEDILKEKKYELGWV